MIAPRVESARVQQRRTLIASAAIEVFSKRGYSGTAMSHIAVAAGLSRPALYQHFRNKDEIFSEAFIALFERLSAAALGQLTEPGTTSRCLDGFVQRFDGDLWQRMAASPHIDDIIAAKNARINDALMDLAGQLHRGLDEFLTVRAPGVEEWKRRDWIELLRFSPAGFRSDHPTVEVYRRRLRALATAVAADIDAQ